MHEVLFAGRSLSAVMVVMMRGELEPWWIAVPCYLLASNLAALSGDHRLV